MRFESTRGEVAPAPLAEALLSGMAGDGGLWVPDALTPLADALLSRLRGMDPMDAATQVARHLFADDLPVAEIDALVARALDFPIPLAPVDDRTAALELFWGPTLAFKDVGARFMAELMAWFRRSEDRELVILVATSGDTGSAVAHAFRGREGFRVVVLFPDGRISEAQQKLFSTLSGNVESLAVAGSFDDCQRLAKEAFADGELRQQIPLASANSINVGRLLPQTLYYFMGYAQVPADAREVVMSTPSGNFGNLTAGLYAKRMGLPVAKFLAATNINDVVPEYLESGDFRPRPSQATLANAMDVGNPSNFERILHLYGGDRRALLVDLAGSRHTDAEVLECIAGTHRRTGMILDPHSAIGLAALEAARARHPDAYGVFLATAHPAKFGDTVSGAIGREVPLPPALAGPMAEPDRSRPIDASYAQLRDHLLAL